MSLEVTLPCPCGCGVKIPQHEKCALVSTIGVVTLVSTLMVSVTIVLRTESVNRFWQSFATYMETAIKTTDMSLT